jgi:hypothetical protein
LQPLLTKAPDALVSQLLIKANVTFTAAVANQMRLFGRKIVPGGVFKSTTPSGK